jgi:hypothetical protein
MAQDGSRDENRNHIGVAGKVRTGMRELEEYAVGVIVRFTT